MNADVIQIDMSSVAIKKLEQRDYQVARELTALYPDIHARYVVERFPGFFSITHFFDSPRMYAAGQKFVLGAYDSQTLIGTVAVQTVQDLPEAELGKEQWNVFFSRFTQHDLDVYTELNLALQKTYIGSPMGSLCIHSLTVSPEYRGRGIAKRLVETLLFELDDADRENLYVETARDPKLQRLFESAGFRSVKKTFSVSERLEFGCWGSILLKYKGTG